ncbi:hypothetical protein DESC_720323 [Desulfosarcina cetonica]|nr:hypothetical protein DESC_720323 [Desulfosarcina cetonica]
MRTNRKSLFLYQVCLTIGHLLNVLSYFHI